MKAREGRRRSLHRTITRYYLSFFALILLSVIGSAIIVRGIATLVTGGFSNLQLEAAVIARADYTKIDVRDIARYGGWVEILRDNKVIYVLGQKQDSKYEYASTDIMGLNDQKNLMQFSSNYMDETYFYSSSLFSGKDGNTYMCMVKIPRMNMHKEFDWFFNTANPRVNLAKMVLFIVLAMMGSFGLLVSICVAIYSRITSQKISKPLEAIAGGLSRVTQGDLSVRLHFEAEQEFADIRDSFNYMAERLQSAEQAKRELEENRKKLVIGISHDLKTPITTVYGYARALSDGMVPDPEKQQKHLMYIRDKAQAMAKLIDDLFQYSTMEGSAYSLKLREEDFAEFLRELIAENYIDIENKGLELELDIPETPVMLPFDRKEMGRALTNIIGNAVKYNPPGTRLFIQLQKVEPELRLVIEDNGIGIAEDIQGEVFDEFVRGDAARPSDGGSGLGLAIARRVVELHCGSIALENGEGGGSQFVISLPF